MKVFMAYIGDCECWMCAALSHDVLLRKIWEHYRDNQQGEQLNPEFMINFPTGIEKRFLAEDEFYGLYLDNMILFEDTVRVMQGVLVVEEESTCCTNADVVVRCRNCGKYYG